MQPQDGAGLATDLVLVVRGRRNAAIVRVAPAAGSITYGTYRSFVVWSK
jgi:hypothetical protein